jgi:hypothetical protein
MSGSDGSLERDVQQYSTVVIVGGGCYGGYYARQLLRAVHAGALSAKRILVVDRDASCAVARSVADMPNEAPPVEIVVAEWSDFFADYLTHAVRDPDAYAGDAIVPSPLMPHLMGQWLVSEARARFGARVASDVPFDRLPDVPWERAGEPGVHYVSFATWTCPINCVEPRTCPHTRDTRTWSLPVQLERHRRDEEEAGGPIVTATLFCRHRSYGVGMFDTAEVIDAHRRIMEAGDRGAADVIIGTVSHCHGALARLVIGAPSGLANSPDS